jgi:ribosomal-protein-alanine N-acetyltransferase
MRRGWASRRWLGDPPVIRPAIRPVTAADEAAFIAAARASRPLHRPWVQAPCDADAFASHLARFDGMAHHGFVVVAAGELAGVINLTHVVMGALRSGYLGYYAFAGFQGRGLMTQGLNSVVRHAFNTLGLHRVEANIQPGNAASIALAKRCGFQLEGFSPRYLKIAGRWRDHERWALVKR